MTIEDDNAQPPRLRRVPLSVELARFGATAWHATRGAGAVVVGRRRGQSIATRGAVETRRRFAALGPTYVKLGQLMASSPGVFPDVLADELRQLLDRVPPADPDVIAQLLASELGVDPHDLFATFDPVPIASASIAQVHAATLRTGERVVVKIRRPEIVTRLAADLQILARVARLLELSQYGRMVGARDVVDDFGANLAAEVDLRAEAKAMDEWRAAVADSPFAGRVHIPTVYPQFSTSKVLVMEYVDAVRIDDHAAIVAAGHDGIEILRTLLLSLLESAFRAGIFHGDLHAGNVLIDTQGRVVFLDWGIVGRFDEERRRILRRLVCDLIVHNDFAAVSKGAVALGAVGKPGSSTQATAHIRAITKPLSNSELGKVSYSDLGKSIGAVAKEYELRLPRDLVLVGKQLLYVERYMKLLAPRWKPAADEHVVGYLLGLLNQAEEERLS